MVLPQIRKKNEVLGSVNKKVLPNIVRLSCFNFVNLRARGGEYCCAVAYSGHVMASALENSQQDQASQNPSTD